MAIDIKGTDSVKDDEYGILHVKYETGSMFYYTYNSQVLLDWVLEPVDVSNRKGAIEVPLPEGFFAYKNVLYSMDDAKSTERFIAPEKRQYSVVLTGQNILMGKAKYMLNVATKITADEYHNKEFSRHRVFSITTGRKQDR